MTVLVVAFVDFCRLMSRIPALPKLLPRTVIGIGTGAVAQTFAIMAHAFFVRVNPLGLQITYFRVDQAFEETRP